MKNKAVEAMIRVPFNVKDNVDVDVKWLWSDGNGYTFEVIWIENDTFHCVVFTLPHLEILKRSF